MPALGEITALLEEWYPLGYAEEWDRGIGLVCGDPADDVRRVLLALDPVAAVATEAVAGEADLLVVHHPLFLKGTTSVAATTPKGRVVQSLTRAGCALYAAHTNADAPAGGVSESLALTMGLTGLVPLEAASTEPLDKLVVFAPAPAADAVRAAITGAGAGAIGAYDSATFTSAGEGRFRPLSGAHPTLGTVGDLETVDEVRIEAVCPRHRRSAVLAALRSAHPYEEPAFDVVELAGLPAQSRGSGRIGMLAEPLTLQEFAEHLSGVLPETAHGVRVSGDPDRTVRRVAVLGGAGDSLLDAARAAGVDAYVTSDLRHHPASEFREYDGPALLDVAHWAAESTWLPFLADRLAAAFAERGDTVAVRVSTVNTDPWTFRVDA